MELKPGDVQEILRIFVDSELEELRIDLGETRLHVSKAGGSLGPIDTSPVPAAPQRAPDTSSSDPAPVAPPAPEHASAATAPATAPEQAAPEAGSADERVELRSPLLGVFYRRPSPDEEPFVEVGATVGPDDSVCVIDVMKMFTRVPAGVAGTIAEICVEDGQLVEHGQVLMRLDPA